MLRTSARPLVLVVLLALMSSVLGCGGAPASSGGSTPIGRRQADSSLEAWPKAEAEMRKTAGDALLLGVGTSGLALADVPDSWNFSFFSPAKNHIYAVSVEHGKAEAPRDLGAARPDTTVSTATEIASIKVGAAQAVVKAREFGEKSATVPKNVVVSGSFAKSPAASGPRHQDRRVDGHVRVRHRHGGRPGVRGRHDERGGHRAEEVGETQDAYGREYSCVWAGQLTAHGRC